MSIPFPFPPTTFDRWASELHLALPKLDINPIAPQEKNWREYGNRLVQSQICQTNNSPRTDGFKTWREWANALIKSFATNS